MDSVQHLQSATQLVTLSNISILTDPWLTDGEYHGSWYHFPKFPEEMIGKLQYDYIYVSHIHPDHCSEETFSKLDASKTVLIPKFKSKFLASKIKKFGFNVEEIGHGEPKHLGEDVTITIYLADNCDPILCGRYFGCAIGSKQMTANIDSLALFENKNHRILNTNDCPFPLAKHTIESNKLSKNITFLSVGYAGAGPFPQCFEFDDYNKQVEAAKNKENEFINLATAYVDLIKPKYFAPFAGTYILGGGLGNLNSLRGVPEVKSATEKVGNLLKNKISKGLALGVLDLFDLNTKKLLRKNQVKKLQNLEQRLSEINIKPLKLNIPDVETSLFDQLCQAYIRFNRVCQENKVSSKFYVILETEESSFCFSTSLQPKKMYNFDESSEPFIKFTLSSKVLRCLLSGPRYMHWNNALIGSHLKIKRRPDIFERGLFHCLNFLHI